MQTRDRKDGKSKWEPNQSWAPGWPLSPPRPQEQKGDERNLDRVERTAGSHITETLQT